MKRRQFLEVTSLSSIAALLNAGLPVFGETPHDVPASSPPPNVFRLGENYSHTNLKIAYSGAAQPEADPAQIPPHVFLMYDVPNKKFVNPSDMDGVSASGTYTLAASLYTFNLATADYQKFKDLQNQLQLGLNVSSQSPQQDMLTWISMNAVNVFGAKPANQSQALSSFLKQGAGTPITPTTKITINKGSFNLQVTAFGQKKDGIFHRLFSILTGVASAPILSTIGIPALVSEALQFTNYILNQMASNDSLVPVWQTMAMPFSIYKGGNALFHFQEGIWVTVDREYARSSNFLDKHTLDIKGESFQIMDQSNKPIDQNYMVAEYSLTSTGGS
jgi:hypothetical protein